MGKIRANSIENTGVGRVSAVFDPQVDKNHSYKNVSCENEILNDPTIEAILVCTPNFRIPELCIRGLESGKHVFSEKPPGFNASDVIRVRETEKKFSNLKLMYGFNHRHHESVKMMKELIDSNEFGKILWMRGRYGKEVDESFFNGWRANPKLSGGGILLDQGIHMLDLFLHFANDFDEVSAFVSNLYWKIDGIEDNVFAIYRNNSSDVCASLHSTMTQWRYLFSLEVFLEKGALILNGLKTSTGVYGDENLTIKRNSLINTPNNDSHTEQTISYEIDTSWNSEILHFVNAIRTNSVVKYGNSMDAQKLMNLIDLTYNSK